MKFTLFLSLILLFSTPSCYADTPHNLQPVNAKDLPILFKKGTKFTVLRKDGSIKMKAHILGNGAYLKIKNGKTKNGKYIFRKDKLCILGACRRLYKLGNNKYQIFKKGKKKAVITIP